MGAILTTLEDIFMALYAIVFVISLIKYPIYKNTALKFLPLILLVTLITERVGKYLGNIGDVPHNLALFNIYNFVYFSFFFYIFMKMIPNDRFKKYIKLGTVIFWLFFISDLVFTGIFNNSFARTYIAGSGILIFCIILYYINILQSSLVLLIKNDLLFWISVGLFLFYIGYIPIKIIKTYFYQATEFFSVLLVIQFSLIIVMYLCFLIGFLWMKKKS